MSGAKAEETTQCPALMSESMWRLRFRVSQKKSDFTARIDRGETRTRAREPSTKTCC